MSKYEIIKNIMESTKISNNDKIYYVEMFVKGWHTEEDLSWIIRTE